MIWIPPTVYILLKNIPTKRQGPCTNNNTDRIIYDGASIPNGEVIHQYHHWLSFTLKSAHVLKTYELPSEVLFESLDIVLGKDKVLDGFWRTCSGVEDDSDMLLSHEVEFIASSTRDNSFRLASLICWTMLTIASMAISGLAFTMLVAEKREYVACYNVITLKQNLRARRFKRNFFDVFWLWNEKKFSRKPFDISDDNISFDPFGMFFDQRMFIFVQVALNPFRYSLIVLPKIRLEANNGIETIIIELKTNQKSNTRISSFICVTLYLFCSIFFEK